MTVLGRHLGHFYAIILMGFSVYVEVESRGHVKNNPNKLKKNRNLPLERSPSSPILRSDGLKPYLGNISVEVGNTSDQFKWPWKTYEDWKKNQEHIENEIDQILIPGGKAVVHASNRTKIPNVNHRRFKVGNSRKRGKKRQNRRKKKLKNLHKKITKKSKPVENAFSGGAGMAVGYYSIDEEVPATFGKFETFIGASTNASSIRGSVILEGEPLQRMKSRWAAKQTRGINGCLINNGGCEGLCVQTKSSFYCHCPDGFRLDSSRRKCLDVNECLSRNGHGRCQGECVNEWGSFKCGCDSVAGTQLDVDGITCVLIDHCVDTECSHICINTRSGAFCSCPEGYNLDNDWKTCKEALPSE